MQSICIRPIKAHGSQKHQFGTLALVLVMGIGGLASMLPVSPVQAKDPLLVQSDSNRTSPKETSTFQQRLEQVEHELEQLKSKEEIAEDKIHELEVHQAEQEREWKTKFDLLRRDPRARLEGTGAKDGWIKFENFDSEVRFGGFFQMNILHNFQDTDNKFGKFHPGTFSAPTEKTTSTEFDPRTTRMVLETRTPTKIGDYSTFVSIDFFGNNDPGTIEPRLRQGYLTGVGVITGTTFLVGEAFSTFRDTQIFPEMFDLQGPNAWSRLFNGMLRWSWQLDEPKKWIATVALEDPDSDISNGNDQTELPDGIVRIDFNGEQHHFMGAFVGRQLKGTDTTGSGKDRAFAYGLNFSGKIGIPNLPDTIKFQGFYGSGIGRYINDLDAAGGQDAVYDDGNRKLKLLESYGGFGAYQHWWTDRWRSTAVFGYVRIDNRGIQPGTAFKSSYYGLANMIYSPFKHYDIGLEYNWGQRKNKNGDTGHASRLMLSAKWHF